VKRPGWRSLTEVEDTCTPSLRWQEYRSQRPDRRVRREASSPRLCQSLGKGGFVGLVGLLVRKARGHRLRGAHRNRAARGGSRAGPPQPLKVLPVLGDSVRVTAVRS